MFFRNKILLLFAVAVLLSGCVQKGETSNSSESPQFSSTEDSQVSSVSESSISESESSESQSESSSDDKVYYTVSIYQSYPKRPDALGRKDTRLDRTFKTEAGKPLYTSDEERRAWQIHSNHNSRLTAACITLRFSSLMKSAQFFIERSPSSQIQSSTISWKVNGQ